MPDERFIGGLRIGLLNATAPLAELLVDDQRVVLRMRWAWLRGFVAAFFFFIDTSWEAPRRSVTAEATRRRLSRGVRLRAAGRPDAIFWCDEYTAGQIAAALQAPPV